MKPLDDLLNAAAAEVRSAAEQVPIPSTFPDDGTRFARQSGSRTSLLVGAAAVVLVVGGIVWIQSRATEPPSVVPAVITSTTVELFDGASPPLELAVAPPGYADVGQIVRSIGDVDIRSAVFVKRDTNGEIIGKVRARVGDFGGAGSVDGTLFPPSPELYQELVTPPANLPTATWGQIFIAEEGRIIYVNFHLGTLGKLELESYHLDAATDLETADQMFVIAAALDLTTTDTIGVVGPLPEGWELAVTGLEPGFATQEFFQGFEVDVPEGGNRIFISNWMTNDVGMPYWEMDDTLEPIAVRGHAGFVSSVEYPAQDPNAPPPPNASGSTSLIWLEAPGHWVTLRGHDMTTEQVLALAEQLTPSANGQWGEVSGSTVTTTTASPVVDDEDRSPPYLGRLAALSESDAALISGVRARLMEVCMTEKGYTYNPPVVLPSDATAEDVLYPSPEELAAYGYAWRSYRFYAGETSTTIVSDSESTRGLADCGTSTDAQMDSQLDFTAYNLDFTAYNEASQVLSDADSYEISLSVETDERMLAANEQWKVCMSDAGHAFDTWGDAERSTYSEGMGTPSALALAKVDYGCRNNFHLAEMEAELRREYVAAWVESHPDWMEALEVAKADLLERAEAILATLDAP